MMAAQAPSTLSNKLSQSSMKRVATTFAVPSLETKPPSAPETDADKRVASVDEAVQAEAPEEGESRHHVTGIKLGLILLGLGMAVLLIALDTAVLATAIPTITNQFNSVDDIGWYGSAYLITICACQPIVGNILKYYSLKWTYLAFIVLFEIGSLICAVAPSSIVLIIGRFVSGLGAAGLFSGALVIIAYIAPLEVRPAYTGIIMASYGLATVVGPIIGGALTQHVTWRWCFYINLPFGGVALGLIFLVVPSPVDNSHLGPLKKLRNLDIPGFLLFSPGIVMLLLALQWGGTSSPWHSATVIGLLCGAVVMLILFAGWQWYLQDDASIPPSVLTQRTVGLCALCAVFAAGGINVINYWLPIWFQAILGSSPTSSGVRFIPTVVANILISIIAGGAVVKLGYYLPFLIVGMALSAISAGLFTTFTVNTNRGMWIGYQILAGLGHGLVIQMLVTAVQAVLPLSKIAAGTTLILFSQFLGGAVFLSIAQNVFQSQLASQLEDMASDVDVGKIVAAGASGFRTMVTQTQLPEVLKAYNGAIVDVFWIVTAGAIVAFLASLGMEWKTVKPPPAAAAGWEEVTENKSSS